MKTTQKEILNLKHALQKFKDLSLTYDVPKQNQICVTVNILSIRAILVQAKAGE